MEPFLITIVDYSAGNPTSVQRALAAVGVQAEITSDPQRVSQAARVIFPGVGHAGSTMAVLKERGLDRALVAVAEAGKPLLGICVGGQLLLEISEESGSACLGLIAGAVRKFPDLGPALKVPHMGWNRVKVLTPSDQTPHPILSDLPPANELYFVHSYYMDPTDSSRVVGTSEHGIKFVCAMAQDNLVAVQFHPEKSGPLGLQILKRFAHWEPSC